MNNMAQDTIRINNSDFKRVMADIELIKHMLLAKNCPADSEGELSDWARKELAEARNTPDSENISLEEMEKLILAK